MGLAFLRSLPLPHKLGLLERLYGRRLAGRGLCTISLANGHLWMLDLEEVTHRWMVYGDYEGPLQMGWLKQWLSTGGVFVDSGANIGQMVVSLSSLPGVRTLAFEPVQSERQWLERCLTRFPAWQVTVVPLGLGEQEGGATIRLSGGRSTLRTDWYSNRVMKEEQIQLTSLDIYAQNHGIDRIRLWKLDMEGYELQALMGAKRLLSEGRIDALMIETQASALPGIQDQLSLGGYRLMCLDSPAQLRPFQLSHWPADYSGNLIALPPAAEQD
ncbi:FkbM family methyltransferase [Cyanobium sp. CH-040]|uniref:FkbM family methyltransferase n=1 Tax=Cyanobium sp. CH-040 TaxID=2823708 RepID=UPI0020CD0D10|nr:FkbM family methyltransferase [Cyanobium sp. CH-040]MCP9927896.1 FkbM family methyltransferase [Cyanobium sp. CH-040]